MPFVDCRSLPRDHRLTADLCIVGSGAAGLSLATQFLGSATRVAVLESGGFEPDEQTQDLVRGSVVGLPYDLASSRLRYFGGTTHHWPAHMRPLDPIDFEARSWIPHSGWPLRYDDLAPYYARAGEFFGLPDTAFDTEAASAIRRPWRFDRGSVQSEVVRIAKAEYRHFAPRFRQEIEESENVTVYLHANVLEVETDPAASSVARLRFGVQPGTSMTAQAHHYVLAAGAIENTRLLLASSRVLPTGLGNRHDLVGRFFGNHLEVRHVVGFYPSGASLRPAFYQARDDAAGRIFGVLRLSGDSQRRHRLLNARIQLLGETPLGSGAPLDLDRPLAEVIFDTDHLGQPEASEARLAGPAQGFFPLLLIAEHAPNPESRVTLGDETDRFGQPRVVLDWRLSELDSRSVIDTVAVLARQMGASGLGRIRDQLPAGDISSLDLSGSWHHTGTTRMHDDPVRGVVDRNCRVHGLSNLFVASSSVFPTHGTANPTLTIIALAFRLATHLKGLLR